MSLGEKRVGQASPLQKTFDILMPFFVYFLVHDLAQVILIVLFNASLEVFGENYTNFMQTHSMTVNGVLNALALLLGMTAVLPMALKEFQGASRQLREEGVCKLPKLHTLAAGPKIVAYGLLLLWAVALAMGMNLLLACTGLTAASPQYTEVANRQYGVALGMGIVLYGVISPLAEEVVFRGLIYNRMKRYFMIPLAIVVCGVLFGFYHGNIVQGIYGCVLGIAITFAYEWYGSFLAPVLFHGAANICVFVVSYDTAFYDSVSSPILCLISMAVSLLCLGVIVRMRKIQRNK